MNGTAGVGLVLAAGVMQGAFPLPLKFTRKWEWENIWLASSILGLVVFPWLIAVWTIPHLSAVLGDISLRSAAVVYLFGAGWGIGGLLFGLGVHRVGVSLTLGIVIGLTSAFGSLVPLAIYQPHRFRETAGILLIAAVVVTFAGLWLCAIAGLHRERNLPDAAETGAKTFRRGSYWAGIAICLLSGLLSPLFNFALICGEPVLAAAKTHGARPADAPNLIWAIAMTGGLVPTAVYCAYLTRNNKSWSRFQSSGQAFDAGLAMLMGALFAFGNSAYGMGAEYMGSLGPIVGWPVFMAVQVVAGNLLAVATGEWRGAGPSAAGYLIAGTAALIIAVFLSAPAGA
jgi:L-rhamnose-H+ transport protein